MDATLAVPNADAQLVALWLPGRSPDTRRVYATKVAGLCAFAARPPAQTTLEHAWATAETYLHARPADGSARHPVV